MSAFEPLSEAEESTALRRGAAAGAVGGLAVGEAVNAIVDAPYDLLHFATDGVVMAGMAAGGMALSLGIARHRASRRDI